MNRFDKECLNFLYDKKKFDVGSSGVIVSINNKVLKSYNLPGEQNGAFLISQFIYFLILSLGVAFLFYKAYV